MDTQDTTATTTTAEQINLLDDFHAALEACGRLASDTLEVIREELGIHKAKLAAAPANSAPADEDAEDAGANLAQEGEAQTGESDPAPAAPAAA